jgi:hypothetical protein
MTDLSAYWRYNKTLRHINNIIKLLLHSTGLPTATNPEKNNLELVTKYMAIKKDESIIKFNLI